MLYSSTHGGFACFVLLCSQGQNKECSHSNHRISTNVQAYCSKQSDEVLEGDSQVELMKNIIEGLEAQGNKLEHVYFTQGTKYYGE